MADASQALLAHLVAQMQQNVDFLVSQQYLTLADGNAIRDKLHGAAANGKRTSKESVPRSVAAAVPIHRATTPTTLSRPPPPPTALVTARALWDYNRENADPADLSFSAGDIIEIVEETNTDWWVGRVHGKEALFPSAYVEKLAASAPSTYHQGTSEKKAYKPFGAAMHGLDAPPPAGQQVAPHPQQQYPQTNSLGLTEDPATAQKKGNYSKYGNTFAHSAVGGVGLGAGSAIGGGLVRAIF